MRDWSLCLGPFHPLFLNLFVQFTLSFPQLMLSDHHRQQLLCFFFFMLSFSTTETATQTYSLGSFHHPLSSPQKIRPTIPHTHSVGRSKGSADKQRKKSESLTSHSKAYTSSSAVQGTFTFLLLMPLGRLSKSCCLRLNLWSTSSVSFPSLLKYVLLELAYVPGCWVPDFSHLPQSLLMGK